MNDSSSQPDATEQPQRGLLELEFTIEPFTEGQPGDHVIAAFDAANASVASGATVEIGPFGTTVTGPSDTVLACSDHVMRAAFAHGANRVSIQVSGLDDSEPAQGA